MRTPPPSRYPTTGAIARRQGDRPVGARAASSGKIPSPPMPTPTPRRRPFSSTRRGPAAGRRVFFTPSGAPGGDGRSIRAGMEYRKPTSSSTPAPSTGATRSASASPTPGRTGRPPSSMSARATSRSGRSSSRRPGRRSLPRCRRSTARSSNTAISARSTSSRLRHGLAAGEALSPTILAEWRNATGLDLYEAFGMSECSTFISTEPGTPIRPGSPGKPQKGRADRHPSRGRRIDTASPGESRAPRHPSRATPA